MMDWKAMQSNESEQTLPRRARSRLFGRRGHPGDKIFARLTLVFALIIVGVLVGLLVALNMDALPAIKHFGLSFLTSSVWNPVKNIFGALPSIYGTLVTSAIALLIGVPISLGVAIFLAEVAPRWLRGPVSFLIEMLAAVPSVIIGLWGIYVLVPALVPVETWLSKHLGFLPLFKGTILTGLNVFSAGIILTFMVIPIITAVSRDAIKAVPDSQREAMLALGATRWETIRRAVLPYCRSSLVGAVILGLGRALGETMAVTMVIGNADHVSAFLFSPGSTIASKIANNFAEASSNLFTASLIELALILFAITLLVNVIARVLVWRMTSVKAAAE
jgi:phosphate transport system permease protein